MLQYWEKKSPTYYLERKCMKRTMARKNMESPQPTWVMIVRFLKSESEMVSLRGVCKKHSKAHLI